LLRDGRPIAALIGGEIKKLSENDLELPAIERALKVGKISPQLPPYYA
jgi:hypothetical protein